MKKIIVVNRELWETRVAVLENGVLQDLYFDKKGEPCFEKSFIKGKISNILPGIQTAFVDIGLKKAGFLHISEVDHSLSLEKLIQEDGLADSETAPRKKIPKNQVSIASLFKNKELVLVQVKKEAIDEKGAKLTTSYTLPGKYLVLIPNIPHVGVSSKIESKAERSRLKEVIEKIIPSDMGVIIRTDAENKSESDLHKDLSMLLDTWKAVLDKFKAASVGEIIHADIPLAARMMREHVDNEPVEIYCDHQDDFYLMKKFLQSFANANQAKLFLRDDVNLFDEFKIEPQINQLLEKRVSLHSGGNIVIEHTEAMTVIDVNTYKFVGKSDQEETTLRTNLEAAQEIVRQLRLRNIGGIIIIDFIDMHKSNNKQILMNFLQDELKSRDKLKSVALNISELGLIQMTRKRSGKSLSQQLMDTCQECNGLGLKESNKTIGCEILRSLNRNLKLADNSIKKAELIVNSEIFDMLSKTEYQTFLGLEKTFGIKIVLIKDKNLKKSEHQVILGKSN